ncbi:hypothetical protein Tco_0157801 [Tanacetum coccineum]
MLAPSGGGLILYQAYGNLYAMTGRKANLLEDKQIPSVGGIDRVAGDGVASIKRRRRDLYTDGVRNFATASGRGRLKEDLESSTWRRRQDYKAMPSRRYLYKYKAVFRVLNDCKSTSGGLQFLGEKLVSWSSKKQDCTAMSTTEAEYVSLSACCAQVIWMRTQLLDYGYKYNRIPMYYDSKSAIAISCNPVQHSRTKHIDIRYHFIKEHVEKGTVELYFVGTEYQLADLFTKALPKERFEYLVHRIGMRCMTPTQLESLAKLSS